MLLIPFKFLQSYFPTNALYDTIYITQHNIPGMYLHTRYS